MIKMWEQHILCAEKNSRPAKTAFRDSSANIGCVNIHRCKTWSRRRCIRACRSSRHWIHSGPCMWRAGDRNCKCQRACMDPSDWRAMLWRHKKTAIICDSADVSMTKQLRFHKKTTTSGFLLRLPRINTSTNHR